MPVGGAPEDQLVRRVRVVHGRLPFRLECRPAFDYARASHETRVHEGGVCFTTPTPGLGRATTVELRPEGEGVIADFVLGEAQTTTFTLRHLKNGDPTPP